jgi:amino acid transporter
MSIFKPIGEKDDTEKRIKAHSVVFKKQLGVKDIVLAQILTVIGGYGIGAAAKLGSAHFLLWLLAVVLFFLPLACVVIYLIRLMPYEGGPYQWAKLGFNEFIGFMVAWNTWLFAIVYISSIGLSVATSLSYSFGPEAAWMAGSKWFIAFLSCLIICALSIIAIVGLGVGKWVHNVGGIILIAVFVLLLALPFLNVTRSTVNAYPLLTFTMPAISLLTITIFVKMAVFSFGGFEYVSILAGECRNPSRAFTKSVLISAPVIALIYIFSTNSVLAFVDPKNVNLINPIAQVFTIGFSSLSTAATLVSGVILAMLMRDIAQSSLTFTGNTRLPMVAGWDHLLPPWFSRLHTKYKTPVNSIVFVGLITLCIGLASILDVGQEEAFQLLQSAAGIFIAFTQLVMFAIPIFGLKGSRRKVSIWIKITSVFGFFTTFVFIVLSVFPIIEVESRLSYSTKIIAIIAVANIIGILLFVSAEKRRNKKAIY